MLVGEKISEDDLKGLVKLHMGSLPTSILSILGDRAVRSYYEHAIKSHQDFVFISRSEQDGISSIAGVCLLSLKPKRLLPSVLKSDILGFLCLAARGLLYRRARAPILKFIFGDKDDQPDTKELPEVVNIFTDPRCRGKGIATDLLAIVERSLLKWNQESYFLKTLNTETNEALHFYRKRGFNEMHRPEAEYIYLQKRCSP